MGAYIIVGVVLLIASLLTIKILDVGFGRKTLIIALIYTIGGVISMSGELAIVTSLYVMSLSIITMYGTMRKSVQKAWDNKDLNDRIDNFSEKMVAKNKRLARENARKEKEKSA